MKLFRLLPFAVLLATLATGCFKKDSDADPNGISGRWIVQSIKEENSSLVTGWREVTFLPDGTLNVEIRSDENTGEGYQVSGKYWPGKVQFPGEDTEKEDNYLTMQINLPVGGDFSAIVISFTIESQSNRRLVLSTSLTDPTTGEIYHTEFTLVR